MAMSQVDLLNTITRVLGLSIKQREVLSDDGCETISTIIHLKYDEIREWCTTKSKFTTTRGEASYGDQKIKCLQAQLRKQEDKDDLNILSYMNKTIFYFEKDVTKMRQIFNVLENNNVSLFEEDKVGQLLDDIYFTNNYLKMRLISTYLATVLVSIQLPHTF